MLKCRGQGGKRKGHTRGKSLGSSWLCRYGSIFGYLAREEDRFGWTVQRRKKSDGKPGYVF